MNRQYMVLGASIQGDRNERCSSFQWVTMKHKDSRCSSTSRGKRTKLAPVRCRSAFSGIAMWQTLTQPRLIEWLTVAPNFADSLLQLQARSWSLVCRARLMDMMMAVALVKW